jgi:ESSS subunit of NADH:ubiquinone oxidoreductase (complex I)
LSGGTTTTTTAAVVAAAAFTKRTSPHGLTAGATTLLLQVRGLGAATGGGGGVPVPRSSQAKLFEGHPTNEGWESSVFFYYTLSAIMLVGILGFAPDTTISSWAKQEATARLKLKESGVVTEFEFGKHYQDLLQDEAKAAMDKFSIKSMRISEDDDDDEEEEEEEEGGDDDDDDDEDEE